MAREVLERAARELRYWRLEDWSFGDVAAHWDAVEDYDEINAGTSSYARRFSDSSRLFHIPSGATVLDLCARTGNAIAFFHARYRMGHVVCADVSGRMGQICRQRLRESGVANYSWVQIFDYALPFATEAFDVVLSYETVEHFAEPERLVEELGRVTKRGGFLVLTTPNVAWDPLHSLAAVAGLHHSEGPHRFLRVERLRRMVERAGFAIERYGTTVLVPAGPSWLVRGGEWLEEKLGKAVMDRVGLRRILVCHKRDGAAQHAQPEPGAT